MKRVLEALVVALIVLAAAALAWSSTVAAQPVPGPGDSLQPMISSAHYAVGWDVLADGGTSQSSAHFKLSSTIGQPAIGNTNGNAYRLHAGYWHLNTSSLLLPLVNKK